MVMAGIVVVLAGLLVYFFHDKLHWIGRLPGDIRIEKEHSRFYFPITTMIVFSLVLSLLAAVFKRFL